MKERDVAEPTTTEQVYADLLHEFRRAHASADNTKAERIWVAILVFEELWPDDCKRWEDRFQRVTTPGNQPVK